MAIDITDLDDRGKLMLVSLYFARLRSDDSRYKDKAHGALRRLAKSYNVKYSKLKNYKDAYDGHFDNGRSGWHQRPIRSTSGTQAQNIYDAYKDAPIVEIQTAAEQIIRESEGLPFYSIKTKSPDQVKKIQNREQNIEVDGLNILKEGLHVGQLVFIVLGGDKGQRWVTWETGLVGIGEISAAPYDEGYEGKNYKIRIDVKVLLNKPIKREDLVPYSDTYDIIGIGPITKWEPNQAISRIAERNAVALMRAMLELSPGCEQELEVAVGGQLMERIKGTAIMLVPIEIDYGQAPPQLLRTDEEAEDSLPNYSAYYEPEIKIITDGFVMPSSPIENMRNLINTGKHIIFTGPPGTGKTTLAERACAEAVRTSYISGHFLTTAISDWTTFDTIGGYMPDKEGRLQFQEGIFLKSIRENKWIIIDEINRAEVDKAFGHFFTVLSGMSVELQYKELTPSGEKNISIRYTDQLGSYYDATSATYLIGKNWRIIATMNTYDKNSLFMLSYAFMRRFAFVHIDSPSERDYEVLINRELLGFGDTAKIILQLVRTSPKKLGAAIILDLISYVKVSGPDGVVSGICSLIVPQYEGISPRQIKQLYHDIGLMLPQEDREVLMSYLCEFFDVRYTELQKVRFTKEQSGLEDEDTDQEDIAD